MKLSEILGPHHRNVFPERFLMEEAKMGYGSDKEIGEALDNPYYRHIKGRYFRTAAHGVYQKMLKSIPISTVMDTMNTLIRPIHTDFTEMNENEDFLRVSGLLYYHLFIQETVYVTYNFFESEDNYILPPNSKKDIREKIEAIKDRGGFDIGVKLTEDELDTDIDFMHIETSLVVKIPDGRKKIASVKGGSVHCGNFRNGVSVTVIFLALNNFLEQMIRLSGKRALVTTNTNSKEIIDRLEGILSSYDNMIHLNLQDMVNVKTIEYVDGELLDAIKDTVYHYIDRLMFEYGRVTNTNPKGERMTTAENFKDMSGIANRQKETLEYLTYFAYQAKKLGGIDLEFAISGIPEKEALPEFSHPAQNPNTEALHKTYQVEGTNPRTPVGQKSGADRNMRGKSVKRAPK